MKLIEGMKKIQELQRKAEDLKKKVSIHCAHHNVEKPVYDNQQNQVAEWIQAHHDILKEILHLRISVQKTNLATNVTIEIGGTPVTKSIAEWIHRRRDLAALECSMWESLTDRNLKEGIITTSQQEKVQVSIVRYYNPTNRDKNIDIYRNEPSVIDRTLEVTNAITDMIE